jgi:hypothetical protein
LILGLGSSNKGPPEGGPCLAPGKGSCRLEIHPSAGVEEVEIVQRFVDLFQP